MKIGVQGLKRILCFRYSWLRLWGCTIYSSNNRYMHISIFSMYVHIYIYIYIYMRVHIHIRIYIYAYVHSTIKTY